MTDLEKLARSFHEAYETLAPSFGYVTRAETREFDPNSANGRLMMAVCEVVLGEEGKRIRSAGRIEGLEEAAAIADTEIKTVYEEPMAYSFRRGRIAAAQAIRARIQELSEQQADQDIAAGRVASFESMDELLDDLDADNPNPAAPPSH
ncbi:MAG: hypothetical protein KF698_08195 [Anaerolineales bacterium]|nr:hypothetical protein [Anaerolineales bacterium]